jgi:PiT family inorganic phosphate transporter
VKKHKPHTKPEDADLIAQENRRRLLVRRSHFMVIITAWIITVPASALLSGIIFTLLNLFISV